MSSKSQPAVHRLQTLHCPTFSPTCSLLTPQPVFVRCNAELFSLPLNPGPSRHGLSLVTQPSPTPVPPVLSSPERRSEQTRHVTCDPTCAHACSKTKTMILYDGVNGSSVRIRRPAEQTPRPLLPLPLRILQTPSKMRRMRTQTNGRSLLWRISTTLRTQSTRTERWTLSWGSSTTYPIRNRNVTTRILGATMKTTLGLRTPTTRTSTPKSISISKNSKRLPTLKAAPQQTR